MSELRLNYHEADDLQKIAQWLGFHLGASPITELPQQVSRLMTLLADTFPREDVLEAHALGDDEEWDYPDAVFLCGSEVVETASLVATLVQIVPEEFPVVCCGGRGHGTPGLVRRTGLTGRTEAEIYAELLRRQGVPERRILVEDRSANCGENAEFGLAVLRAYGHEPSAIGVVQDPTMLRRTVAGFARWIPEARIQPLSPFLVSVRPEGPDPAAWSSAQRFVDLVLGEVPRLRSDGYGPLGRGFIAEVEVPDEIERAYARTAHLGSRPA